MANKIELKWYEKKQGIHIKQKISAEQKKIDADEKQRVAGRFSECGEDLLKAGLFWHVRQCLLLE